MSKWDNKVNRSDVHVIGIDFDGVLCTGDCYTEKGVECAKPIQENIDFVNELSKTNFIVIWTARRDHLVPATLRWLRNHNVIFHAFSNNKTPLDIFLDDRAYRPDEKSKILRKLGRR